MTTKNYICILAGATLLVSCTPTPTTTTTTAAAARPTPTPRPRPTPRPPAGKRTETGTVIGLTATQITLKTAREGTWVIKRTVDTTVSGTLTLGSTVTVIFDEADGHQVSS
jgi:hypothetical protein